MAISHETIYGHIYSHKQARLNRKAHQTTPLSKIAAKRAVQISKETLKPKIKPALNKDP
jgi:IS30 family transposase